MLKQNLLIIYLLLILIIKTNFILTLNIKLNNFEENLLYNYLKNQTNLKLFYEKLIHSNGIENLKDIRHKITNEDIQKENFQNKCFRSIDDLFNAFNINSNENLTNKHIKQLTPALINVKFNEGCQKIEGTTKWKNIFIGLISVTIINLTALFGAIILPFRNKSAFKWILCTFIGLAVGTLVGTGIFHLIPMAFSVENFDFQVTYLNKGLITIIIIYLFYMRDQLCKVFFHVQTIVPTHSHGEEEEEEGEEDVVTKVLAEKNTKSLRENLRTMKPIGWMILIGDSLHGFIDGLTIGAIAMVSISECIRMMVPIACEEFSHKLGDTAILLNSGLPIKQALLINFLSACGCYPGFLVGAKLGELENFHPWICALAGGMFVYIGLTDMIPELISMGNEIEKDYLIANKPVTILLKLKILFSQNLGVIIGISTMFLLAKYGEILSQYF